MNSSPLLKQYHQYLQRKSILFAVICLLLPFALFLSLVVGPVSISPSEIVQILLGNEASETHRRIIYHFRLPQTLAALFAGAGLAISGATMQAVLRNPLCSPFTLGISSAAIFGAALVIFLSEGSLSLAKPTPNFPLPFGTVTAGAFLNACLATTLILALSRKNHIKPETIILLGVALGSFYGAGTMMLQYFATEWQLAAMVYWTFGDTQRANWQSIKIITPCVTLASLYFFSQAWNYNSLALGEENAQTLGVPVQRLRLGTMLCSSLLISVLVASLGIIGFVGLVVPHGVRFWVGADYRFVLPGSLAAGALLLILADTTARCLTPNCIMPVSILTAFLGAPLFFLMLLNKKNT